MRCTLRPYVSTNDTNVGGAMHLNAFLRSIAGYPKTTSNQQLATLKLLEIRKHLFDFCYSKMRNYRFFIVTFVTNESSINEKSTLIGQYPKINFKN